MNQRSRLWLSRIFLVAFVISATFSAIAHWLRDSALDTSTFVSTTSDLIRDPAIASVAANLIAERLITTIDENVSIEDRGVGPALFANQLAVLAQDAVSSQVESILRSQPVVTAWSAAMEQLHPRIVALLKGESDGDLAIKNGVVTINIQPLLVTVQTILEARGVDVFSVPAALQAPLELRIADARELNRVQIFVRFLDDWSRWLVVIAFASLVGYIGLSVDRSTAIITAGLTSTIAFSGVLFLLNVARRVYADRISEAPAASASFLRFVTYGFRNEVHWLVIIGAVITISAWLIRRHRHPSVDSGLSPVRQTSDWLAVNRQPVLAALLLLFAIAVAVWDGKMWNGWFAVIVLCAVLGVVAWFAAMEPKARPRPMSHPPIPVANEPTQAVRDLFAQGQISGTEFIAIRRAQQSTGPVITERMLTAIDLYARGLLTGPEFFEMKQALMAPVIEPSTEPKHADSEIGDLLPAT